MDLVTPSSVCLDPICTRTTMNTFSSFVLIINEFGQARNEKFKNRKDKSTELLKDGQQVFSLTPPDSARDIARASLEWQKKIKLMFQSVRWMVIRKKYSI